VCSDGRTQTQAKSLTPEGGELQDARNAMDLAALAG